MTKWLGTIGTNDDFGAPIGSLFIDGATRAGPWAIMTPESWRSHGRGIGIGRGQLYRRTGPDWLRVQEFEARRILGA